MEKKLPKVFANKIEKEIENNEKIYISNKKTESDKENKSEREKEKTKKNINQEKTINQKIKEIFNTKKYIYKIPVKIETKTNTQTTKIIGKNKNSIITIDNQLIKIEDIINIEIKE